MRALSRIVLFCIALVAAAAYPSGTTKLPNIERREISSPLNSNNNLMGIASIAGITSRNGRVSSLTGVKLIPGGDSTVKMAHNGNQFFYPLSVTKESDGKYASGSIQIYPGSVTVTSSARSGFGPEIKAWTPKLDMPLGSEMFFSPIDLFNTPRSIKPLFPTDIFKPIPPPQITDLGTTWLYPNFNPFFSFWR